MKNNHQILFIFPPVASPVSPYLSTPLLAGQLSNNGFNTTCLDLSVEFFNHILKREYILNAYNIAKNEYINLKSIIGNKSSNDNDFLTYPFENKKQIFKKEAIEKYVQNEKKIIEEVENIDFAIHSYKNKNDFYNPELMQKASDIINTAFEIIMLQYFPAQLFFHKYTNIEYKSTYKALEYQALQNNNIFYDFYKQKIDEHNIKNYDLICISCPNQTQILPSMILARMIKEQSNAKIVLGGNIVSRIDKNLQKIDKIFNSFFDFIISGCGEKSLIKLAEHIFYKKGNGKT